MLFLSRRSSFSMFLPLLALTLIVLFTVAITPESPCTGGTCDSPSSQMSPAKPLRASPRTMVA